MTKNTIKNGLKDEVIKLVTLDYSTGYSTIAPMKNKTPLITTREDEIKPRNESTFSLNVFLKMITIS
jgi:hypothetical protein